MCDVDFDGACDVWSETPRRARKERKCSCCQRPIRAGEVYLSHFSVYERESSSQSLCFPCWWVREDFQDAHGCGIQPAYVMELIRDCLNGDDDESEWRPHLAVILSRNRTSERGRSDLRMRIESRRAYRELRS